VTAAAAETAPATGNTPASPASGTAEVTEIHPDQLDPAWEADVYLRYGRYPQAETLIRASLKREPDREDLKLKLCEILNLSRQSEAFAAYIRELQATGEALSGGFWSAVQAMRPELLGDITPQPTHTKEPAKTSSEPPAEELAVIPVIPPTTGPETETLDLEDTDFSAELLALEAQLGSLPEPGPAHPLDTMGPEVVSLSTLDDDQSLEQALEALTDLKATPATRVAEATPLELDEGSEAIDAVDGQALDTEPEVVDFYHGDELAALERLLEPAAALANPDNEPEPVPAHGAAALADATAEATEAEAAPALPEHDNLLEFVPPVNEELLPDDPSQGDKAEALILENLIPFDTSGLTTPSALPARPAAPATATVPTAQALTDELDFESLSAFTEDGGSARNADFGVLDFELDLIDPRAQEDSQPVTTADSTSPQASPLDIARRLARDGDKIAARQMLKELIQSGEGSMQDEARLLLEEISKVRLSLVTGPLSDTPPEAPFVPAAKATPGA
jgi:pilus assembly protein FimV